MGTLLWALEVDEREGFVFLHHLIVGVVDVDDVVVEEEGVQLVCGDVLVQVPHVESCGLLLHFVKFQFLVVFFLSKSILLIMVSFSF